MDPAGGLTSYGVDLVDMFWHAASYVDGILRGDNPADLPVQPPTKFMARTGPPAMSAN